jgi:cell division transport system ATP-binding protein
LRLQWSGAMSGIVHFENVGLRYGTGSETLSNLSLSLAPGSFYFVTGASGAGKTSLLRLITLAQRPSRGIIRLFGEDIVTLPREALPGVRRRVGVVYQDFRLIPHLTAFENVALPLRIMGQDDATVRATVKELMEWVGLTPRAEARPPTLSGGEQQRVAIARAIVGRPDLIVADEPTGNVDPDMAMRLFQLFEGLHKLGTTVLVATHDLPLVARFPSATILRLAGGTIEDPSGLLRHPAAPRQAYR